MLAEIIIFIHLVPFLTDIECLPDLIFGTLIIPLASSKIILYKLVE